MAVLEEVRRPRITEEDLKADFRLFLAYVWKQLNLPVPTWIQRDIAHYLQHGPRRCIIMAFRGVGKSWITSAFVVWLLLVNPQLKILVVSASKDRADAFSTFTKRLINELPLLQHLRPDPKKNQRDSNVAFDVGPAVADHAPSVKSVGITGQLAGSRADVIIPDDVEIPNNSLTQLMRDRLAEAVKEFDAVIKPNGRIIYLGTPQTEMSVYNQVAERGYEIRIWTARYPKADRLAQYGEKLAPCLRDAIAADPDLCLSPHHTQYGKPTDPVRFDEQDLLEREASWGRSGFALQYQLDTTVSDANRYPLKLADLMVTGVGDTMAPVKMEWASGPDAIINDLPMVGLAGDRLFRPGFVSKEWAEFEGCAMYIDPSGRGRDETAYAIVKMLAGRLFLVACGGFTSGYEDATLKALSALAKRHGVKHVLIEENFGNGMFKALLDPVLARIHPVTTEEVHSVGQKEARVLDVLEPVLNQHRLVVDIEVIKQDALTENPKYQLFYQMTRLTRDRGALAHDDRIEALAGAVAYWVRELSRDSEQALVDHRERARDMELAKFMDACFPGIAAEEQAGWSDFM